MGLEQESREAQSKAAKIAREEPVEEPIPEPDDGYSD